MPKLFETKLDKAGDVINKTPVLSHGLKFANKWSEHNANVLQNLREHNESSKFGRFMNKTDDILRAPEKFVNKLSSTALGKVSDWSNVDPRALMIAGALTPVGRKLASKAKPLVNKAANKAVLKILRSTAKPAYALGPKKPGKYIPKHNRTTMKLKNALVEVDDVAAAKKLAKERGMTTQQFLEQSEDILEGGLLSNKLGKKPLSKTQWLSEAKEHYLSNYKNSSEPFKGFPRYTDESGTTWRATTGNKIPGTDRRTVTRVNVANRKSNQLRRAGTETKWEVDLKKALDELNLSDKFDEYSQMIRAGNRVQDVRRSRLNAAKKKRGFTKAADQLTIEHIGALKNKWPNIPENRWGLITRRDNSMAGALQDPRTKSIRYSGTPRDMKEWVLKQQIGANVDPTADLPHIIRRKILKAKTDNQVNDILTDYFDKTLKIKP